MRPLPQSLVPAVAWLAAWSLRLLAATWRVETVGRNPMELEKPPAVVAAFWHENVLVMAALFRALDVTASVSRSRDGDLISTVLRSLGYARPARGSSSAGGAGLLRELVRRVRRGNTVAMPVDGPRGPAHQAKPGIVGLAAITGVPITPVAIHASPATHFASWDRTRLPWPFARIVMTFGESIPVPRSASENDREAARSLLERTLS